jgi:hypothetical protein
MMLDIAFDATEALWLTPVPGHTAPLPAQTGCATEQLLCELFFEAVSFGGFPPRHRCTGHYGPWVRVAQSRPPHLSSLDAGPVFVDAGRARLGHEGEPRWLRNGALELAA